MEDIRLGPSDDWGFVIDLRALIGYFEQLADPRGAQGQGSTRYPTF